MSILDANGSVACAECGRKARDERDRLQAENAKLRELCCEMFKEHQRIYHAGGTLKMGPSATNKQMAHWYSECMRWGVEVDG